MPGARSDAALQGALDEIVGWARSFGVMELIMASIRMVSLSSI